MGMIISILVLYIMYCCCIKFNARRKAEKEKNREKRRTFIMKEMENKMRTAEGKPNLAIDMGSQPSCERVHLHFPPFHKTDNDEDTKRQDCELAMELDTEAS